MNLIQRWIRHQIFLWYTVIYVQNILVLDQNSLGTLGNTMISEVSGHNVRKSERLDSKQQQNETTTNQNGLWPKRTTDQ